MTQLRADPVTFEVLRHRLWAINDEAAATLRLVSGSPVATEVRDFNTSLMSATGEAFVVGPYIASHAVSQQLVAQNVLETCQENPGIGVDDIFICNDPYSGAIHQNDVTVVAPIHWEGELVGWAGATIHQIDVGGPVKGSQGSIGSKSIYEEAPPMPPVKLVEGGVMRRDLEREYLIRSRTRELNALDLRAKIAAMNVAKRRIHEVIRRYGAETYRQVVEAMMDYTATRLRARLRDLPDGTWRHISHLDYDDGIERIIYPLVCTMTKQGDRLTFDHRGTAPQAPALINCTYTGLLTGCLMSVLTTLCYEIPWSIAGVMRAIDIISEPGTLTDATWPAGVAKATTAASFAASTVTMACMAKMLASSPEYRDRLMAPWAGALPTQELFGVDQRGDEFGGTILDPMAGGAGARSYKDGIDTGGFSRSLAATIANVETYEFRYPVLYLYRRQESDSGGPGRFRGGVGVSMAYTPHGVDEITTNIMHTFCVQQPEASGIAGGYPGCTNEFAILRDSDVWNALESGVLPGDLGEIEGRMEIQPSLSKSYLRRGDVYRSLTSGGGGYGDPLDRDPERVLADVLDGLVSVPAARALYGVEVDIANEQVVPDRTEELRRALRAERAARAHRAAQ